MRGFARAQGETPSSSPSLKAHGNRGFLIGIATVP